MRQETGLIQEISRQMNRQIARTLDDLKGSRMSKVELDRIKRGFYDMAEELQNYLQQEKQINDKSNK